MEQQNKEKKRPMENKQKGTEEDELPEGWVKRHSKSKDRPYYYNTKTQESVWEKPQAQTNKKTRLGDKPQYCERDEVTGVQASHILVKHRESRRPSSWKEANITRTKEEAMKIIKEFKRRLESEEIEFGELARKESDCSSAQKDGDLGFFTRGKMQKPFEDAAFALQIGQMSDVVSTESGLHLILRTA